MIASYASMSATERRTNIDRFKELFKFDQTNSGLVGIEREAFIVNRQLAPVPVAESVLAALNDTRYTYELSACQIEMRTSPNRVHAIGSELVELDMTLRGAANALGYFIDFSDVAPATMNLKPYPDPTGRYQRIIPTLPHEVLVAACRIIGTHIHFGLRDHATALRVYNTVVKNNVHWLSAMGDCSQGERMRLYRTVAPNCDPPLYETWDDFYDDAVENGFVEDPRKNWRLVRLTAHGTIEARMFGSTKRIDEVLKWTRMFHALCIGSH